MESSSGPNDELSEVHGGLDFVRQHRQMYRHIAYDGPSAAASMAEAAMRVGAQRVHMGHVGSLYFVAADVDWLVNSGDRDVFTELVPFPEFGQNGIHPEVVVAAFSKLLVTIVGSTTRVVVGELPSIGIDFAGDLQGRTVLFEF